MKMSLGTYGHLENSEFFRKVIFKTEVLVAYRVISAFSRTDRDGIEDYK